MISEHDREKQISDETESVLPSKIQLSVQTQNQKPLLTETTPIITEAQGKKLEQTAGGEEEGNVVIIEESVPPENWEEVSVEGSQSLQSTDREDLKSVCDGKIENIQVEKVLGTLKQKPEELQQRKKVLNEYYWKHYDDVQCQKITYVTGRLLNTKFCDVYISSIQ